MLKAIRSSPHLKVKFPTPHGIKEVKGDQQVARQCYNTAIKLKGKELEKVGMKNGRSNLSGGKRFVDVQRRSKLLKVFKNWSVQTHMR